MHMLLSAGLPDLANLAGLGLHWQTRGPMAVRLLQMFGYHSRMIH